MTKRQPIITICLRGLSLFALGALSMSCSAQTATTDQKTVNTGAVLTGQEALGDYTTDAPGVRRKITTADLPAPYDTRSAANFARVVPRPEGALP